MKSKLNAKVPCDPSHVGAFGGSGPRDLMNPDVNVIKKPKDEDQDGKKDYGVSRELSEDRNTLFSRK